MKPLDPRTRALTATLLTASLCIACSSVERDRAHLRTEVLVANADQAPMMDGRGDDAVWAEAPETLVDLETQGVGPSWCRVRSVVANGRVHILIVWPDDTEDREHKPHTLQADGSWGQGPEREDVLAVGFPMEGEFTADMLSPVECVWDVWHWKSARTDPAGFAMDKTHLNSFTDPGGKRHAEVLADGRTLYIARPEDAGTSATGKAPEPAGADSGPAYLAQVPSDSAADVRAAGSWVDGEWTLELSRALATGYADDVDLTDRASIPFALAILDHAEDEDHAVSAVLQLIFE